MNHRAYRIGIGYFTLFALTLLVSGFVMFWLKTGSSFEGVATYYGDKSVEGLLELAHPHLGSMGLFIMVLGHFFLFTERRHQVRWGFVALFMAALLSILTPYGILEGIVGSVALKLVSVVTLVGLSSYYALLLLREILRHR